MDWQCSEGLSCPLREAYVRQRRLSCGVEDIINAVRNIMECKLVHWEIPEFSWSWRMECRLFRILVSTVVAQLHHIRICVLSIGTIFLPKRQSLSPQAWMADTALSLSCIPILHYSWAIRGGGIPLFLTHFPPQHWLWRLLHLSSNPNGVNPRGSHLPSGQRVPQHSNRKGCKGRRSQKHWLLMS